MAKEGSTESVLEKEGHPARLGVAVPILKGCLIFLPLGFIYYPTLAWMWGRWFAADLYYSHGFLVPIVSGLLIWFKRGKLAGMSAYSSRSGLGFLLAGLSLHVVSGFARVHPTSAFSLLLVLLGLTLYLFGGEITRVILFPLCFLFFMLPAPAAVLAGATLRMKFFATDIASAAIQLFGVPVVREGSMVYMENTSVMIDDPCSGLKSLLSLSAVGVLYAYLVRAPYIKRIIFSLLSVPIAIAANIIRVVAVLLVVNAYGDKVLTNSILHGVFGFMVYMIALVGLILVGRLMGCQVLGRNT